MSSFMFLPAAIMAIIGFGLLALQVITALHYGYFSVRQRTHRGLEGYTLTQHGGACSDLIIITPLLVWLCGKYRFRYLSFVSLEILFVCIIVWWILLQFYREMGKTSPEVYTHHGFTTIPGILHGIYAVIATWIVAMTYLPYMTAQPVTNTDIVITSIFLTPWAALGAMKFSRKWHWDNGSVGQVFALLVLIWSMTTYRIS